MICPFLSKVVRVNDDCGNRNELEQIECLKERCMAWVKMRGQEVPLGDSITFYGCALIKK